MTLLDERPTEIRHDDQQLPLFDRPAICDPGPWLHNQHYASMREIGLSLPANLGWETTDGRTCRLITIPHAMRRALEQLDIAEGDVIPDALLVERRRRVVEAELLIAQAKAVLRAVNLELQTWRAAS